MRGVDLVNYILTSGRKFLQTFSGDCVPLLLHLTHRLPAVSPNHLGSTTKPIARAIRSTRMIGAVHLLMMKGNQPALHIAVYP